MRRRLNRYGKTLVEFEMSKLKSGRVKQKECEGLKRRRSMQREDCGGKRRYRHLL